MSYSGDSFLEMRAIKQAQIDSLDNLFDCANIKPKKIVKPIINIIIRTHARPEYFKVMMDSIKSQTYPNYTLIVGSDTDCPYYPLAQKLLVDYRKPDYIPEGMYYSPWNLYLETLAKSCVNGWLIYQDDDDRFTNEKSLQRIVNAINNNDEDSLIIWRVKITKDFIVPSYSFGHVVTAGDISGIGIAFHTKHLPVSWGCLSYGDFRICTQLIHKGLKPVWIDMILTETQNGPRNGR
jgi:glycosyltransferase involved in cell wall biosynthesis